MVGNPMDLNLYINHIKMVNSFLNLNCVLACSGGPPIRLIYQPCILRAHRKYPTCRHSRYLFFPARNRKNPEIFRPYPILGTCICYFIKTVSFKITLPFPLRFFVLSILLTARNKIVFSLSLVHSPRQFQLFGEDLRHRQQRSLSLKDFSSL